MYRAVASLFHSANHAVLHQTLSERATHALINFAHCLHMIATNRAQGMWPTIQHALVRCLGGSILRSLCMGVPLVSVK